MPAASTLFRRSTRVLALLLVVAGVALAVRKHDPAAESWPPE